MFNTLTAPLPSPSRRPHPRSIRHSDLRPPPSVHRHPPSDLRHPTLARTTVYFRFYLFEALFKHGRADQVLQDLDFWRQMPAAGFKTTPESPEPNRSDCHAWGAHPLFFMISGFLGLRPTQPDMEEIIIAPQPAGLPCMKRTLPTPHGPIIFDLRFKGDACEGQLTLPSGIRGRYRWGATDVPVEGTPKLSATAES